MLKDISYLELFDQRSGPICTILVEDIMRNAFVKLFRIWTNGSVDVV